jgi:hypothetical protein
MKRVALSPEVQAKAAQRAAAIARITQLEASQHGHVRRLALGDATAVEPLRAIDDEIGKLSADL